MNNSEEKKASESVDDPNDGDDEEDGEDEKDPNFGDELDRESEADVKEEVSDEADVLTQQDLEETALNQQAEDQLEGEADGDADEEALPMLQSDSDDDDEIDQLADLAGTDEFGKKEYVFIDNLPKEKHEIAALLKEVNKNIARLEEQFFIEEDSEAEAERFGLRDMPTPDDHNQRLDIIKKESNIQQFWSIPLCE